MFKKVIALIMISSLSLSLAGCGSDEEIKNLNNLSALGSGSNVNNNYALSYTDQQELVYAQVSNRTLLDLSTLDACTDAELSQVTQYMDTVDDQLVGNIPADDNTSVLSSFKDISLNTVDKSFTNYLLAEFEKTPYYWQRSSMTVRGVDKDSKSIVVDVTYKTINHAKEVKPKSTIVLGSPAYSSLMKNRYDKYCAILGVCKQKGISVQQLRTYGGDDSELTSARDSLNKWVEVYGEPSQVYEEQTDADLTDDIYKTGNQKTYEGVIDADFEKSGASMTVRYVLIPKFVLGINLGLTCKHLYITDYKLNNDITEGKEVFKSEGYATVTDNVYELLYSYFKCIDESDFTGLYKLSSDFSGLDNFYKDKFNTSYNKHNNFTVSVFDIKGTHISCGVSISSKSRAKGSNITMPIYTDRYYAVIDLVGDSLKVSDLCLLSRTIEGEPAITTEKAGVTGFSKEIDLSNSDKKSIEDLICNFGVYQLKGDTLSTGLEKIIDYSMSVKDMTVLKENMSSLSGKKKVVFLQNYMQGTKNYATVKCKELYQTSDNNIVEASVTYDFILKGKSWVITGYDIASTNNLTTTNLQTLGSLCVLTADKIESYDSQVKKSDTKDLDEKSDTSRTFDYKEYSPSTKTGNESGNIPVNIGEMSDTMFSSVDSSYNKNLDLIKKLNSNNKTEYTGDTLTLYQNVLCFVYNVKNGRINSNGLDSKKSSYIINLDAAISTLKSESDYKDCITVLESAKKLVNGV